MIHLIVKRFFKNELNSVPMREFVGLRPKCFAFLCTGKVDKNVLHYTRPVEKKTAKGVKRKMYYLEVLRSFKLYVCKQNLISSTNHTVRTVYTRKVVLTAFDTKRWLCEDTVHSHSHCHKETVSDPSDLFSKSSIVNSLAGSSLICLNQSVSAFNLRAPR